MRQLLCLALALALALGGCAAQPARPDDGRLAAVDLDALRETTEHLCNTIGPRVSASPEERATADYLTERLAALGYSEADKTLERVTFALPDGQTSENLVVTVGPRGGDLFAVVAHYDSVAGSPGARDNAGSVAALLEIARLLAETSPAAETRLVFLGSEENGYHGSAAYVAALSPEEQARHRAVYNMDISVASPDAGAVLTVNTLGGRGPKGYVDGNHFEPFDNLASRTAADAYRALTGATEADNKTKYIAPFHYGESDHLSFHNAGIDAANICWRRPNGDYCELPEEYHKSSDTPDTLDYQTLELTAATVLRALELAQNPDTYKGGASS